MAFPYTNNSTGLNTLVNDMQMAVKFETEATKYMATIQDPTSSVADKLAAFNFFNGVTNPEGEYALLAETTGGLTTARTDFLQSMQTTLEKEDVQMPIPGGGTVQVYKNDSSGAPATLWDFISNPNASYCFHFTSSDDDLNNGANDGNNWWATSGISFGRQAACGYSGSDTTISTDGNGASFSGGGSIVVHTDGEKCQNAYSFTAYANATTIEQYISTTTNN